MIRIYYMNLEDTCLEEHFQTLYEMLPPERKESVNCARKEKIAKKRLYTGAFLQNVLSRETGIPINEICYEYNEWGKPRLKTPETMMVDETGNVAMRVHFNLSHSGRYAVLAIGDSQIGIDVEHKVTNCTNLAKRCFCEEEYNDIMSQDTDILQERRFLEYWTMKESYIKCIGEGLRIPLNSFFIKREDDGISYVEDTDMWLGTFFLDEEYCVSVCSRSALDVEEIVKARGEYLSKVDFLDNITYNK